jgi:hypothetical protein
MSPNTFAVDVSLGVGEPAWPGMRKHRHRRPSPASCVGSPGHDVRSKSTCPPDVPVRGQHLHRVVNDAHGHLVLGREFVGGQMIAVLVFAAGDLVAQDAGELDILR